MRARPISRPRRPRERDRGHRRRAALGAFPHVREAIRQALDLVRERFGWAYGSYWQVDPADRALHFVQESGDAGEEFRQVTLAASFREGVGLAGRAWKARDLVFVPDLGQLSDCVRAPAAQRVGVRSGICFPLLEDGVVTGTMDFFATETLDPSRSGWTPCGRSAGWSPRRSSGSGRRAPGRGGAGHGRGQPGAARGRARGHPRSRHGAALDSIREGFGWAYGSYWAVDAEQRALTFVQESGSAGEEFRQVTLAASFQEGVGLSGRTWRARDLVFVEDLAQVTDCVRASRPSGPA